MRKPVTLIALAACATAALGTQALASHSRSARRALEIPFARAYAPFPGDRFTLRITGLSADWRVTKQASSRDGAHLALEGDECKPLLYVGGLISGIILRKSTLTGASLQHQLKLFLKWPGPSVEAKSTRIRRARIAVRKAPGAQFIQAPARHASIAVITNGAGGYPLFRDYLVTIPDRQARSSHVYRVMLLLAEISAGTASRDCARQVRDLGTQLLPSLISNATIVPR